jgi:transposase-like protein
MRGRRGYPSEFKAEAVELYLTSGKSIRDIATELGIAPESLRRWHAQQNIDAGKRSGLTTDERQELTELRRKLRRVTMERDILKKATAFFANENGGLR